ncbi:hypothetical protein [Clostridium sp. DL1XJH146]
MKANDTWVKVLLIGSIIMLVAMVTKNANILAFGFPIVCFSWMWLGALKKGKVYGVLRYGLISLLVIWWGGFFAMLNFDMSKLNGFVLGFPKATAIMIYIVWLLPLFTGTWLFGKRFKKDYLTDEDIIEFNARVGSNIATEKELKELKNKSTKIEL